MFNLLKSRSIFQLILLLYILVIPLVVIADAQSPKIKIMAVEFELRDVSPLPNVAQEVERTQLIDGVIKKVLTENGYEMVPACDALKKAYEQGNGYLYDRPEIAGKLGGECGADYVYMGQTWKPSFLFVFPQVQIVDTRQNLTRAQLVVVSRVVQLEASTLDTNVTEVAGKKLAAQIIEKLKSVRNKL